MHPSLFDTRSKASVNERVEAIISGESVSTVLADQARALRNAAIDLAAQGHFDAAYHIAHRAMLSNSEDPVSWALLANCLDGLGEFEQADSLRESIRKCFPRELVKLLEPALRTGAAL